MPEHVFGEFQPFADEGEFSRTGAGTLGPGVVAGTRIQTGRRVLRVGCMALRRTLLRQIFTAFGFLSRRPGYRLLDPLARGLGGFFEIRVEIAALAGRTHRRLRLGLFAAVLGAPSVGPPG